MLAEGELDMILPMAWTKKTGKSGKQSIRSKLRANVKKRLAIKGYPTKSKFHVASMHEKAKIV